MLPKLEGPVESLPLHRLRSMIPILLSAELGNKRPIYEASFRPDWWPVEIPFVNVRQTPDSVESKYQVSQIWYINTDLFIKSKQKQKSLLFKALFKLKWLTHIVVVHIP